jgi:hypothetical protein
VREYFGDCYESASCSRLSLMLRGIQRPNQVAMQPTASRLHCGYPHRCVLEPRL